MGSVSSSTSYGASHSSIGSASTWHSKVAPISEVNMKDARTELVVAGGPSWMSVTGGVPSLGSMTRHV